MPGLIGLMSLPWNSPNVSVSFSSGSLETQRELIRSFLEATECHVRTFRAISNWDTVGLNHPGNM